MSVAPYMPLYVADYLADTGHLSTLEHGAYLLLLMHYWRAGALPTDDRKLANICRVSTKQWASIRPSIAAFFDADWKHKRVQKEIDNASRKAGIRATSGSRGGKAKALKNKQAGLANATILPEQNASKTLPSSSVVIEEEERSSSSLPSSLRSDSSTTPENGADDLFGEDVKPAKPKNAAAKAALKDFGEGWNDLAGQYGFPPIELIKAGSARERAALRTIRDLKNDYGADANALFNRIRGSPYLRGEINGFRCMFDWICAPKNLQKIMEDTYAPRQKVSRQQGSDAGYR